MSMMVSYRAVLFPTRCLGWDLGLNWVSFWGFSYLFYSIPEWQAFLVNLQILDRQADCRLYVSISKQLHEPGLPWSGENIWKMKSFLGQRKVRKFCGCPGKFRKDLNWKVREFENKWILQAVFRKFIYSVQEGRRCTFSWDSRNPSPSFKSNPQIWSDTVNTIKVKNKNVFFYLLEGMENCKMSGKNQGKVREFCSDDKWQLWWTPNLDLLPLFQFGYLFFGALRFKFQIFAKVKAVPTWKFQ